jgi:azurin
MKIKLTVLAVACALTLTACSDKSSSPVAPGEVAPSATAPAQVETPAPAATLPPAATTAAMPAATPAMNGKPTAVVTDCATEIEGNDSMQYNVSSIVVPASCQDFKITLKHVGKLSATAMGHDVVIAKAADVSAVDADGIAAGAAAGYVKPDDARVIAHTSLVGGGETTSVSFATSKLKDGGPYEFFCSFPGHSALMKGSISVQ